MTLRLSTSYFLIGIVFLLASCGSNPEGPNQKGLLKSFHAEKNIDYLQNEKEPVSVDLDDIKESGKLTILTDYNPLRYFLYKGQPMGYGYDVFKMIRDELNLDLVVKTVKTYDEAVEKLNEGTGDVIIMQPDIDKERERRVTFTNTYVELDTLDKDIQNHLAVNITPANKDVQWAVRNNAESLRKYLNKWIRKNRDSEEYAEVHEMYFNEKEKIEERMTSSFCVVNDGEMCEYDKEIKEKAEELGWDWRLLAAQIFQESKFNAHAESWAGAKGLMQVMPGTARPYVGNQDLKNPHVNMKAGISYIKYLYDYWDNIDDPIQKIKFVMASYNAGPGHISDARRLAIKHGFNPQMWDDNVEKCIRLLEQKKYYKDPVVRYGYARGEEPYLYVRYIFARYHQYQNFFIPKELEEMNNQPVMAEADTNKKPVEIKAPQIDSGYTWAFDEKVRKLINNVDDAG